VIKFLVLLKGRDFLAIKDFNTEELSLLWETAFDLKRKQKRKEPHELLKGKTLIMIFTIPSTRTRISFESSMTQLGGHAQFVAAQSSWVPSEETWCDAAKVMSRYGDGIVARIGPHYNLEEITKCADVPVINAGSDLEHPCQAMADIMTVREKKRDLKGIRYAFCWAFAKMNKPIGIINSNLYAAAGTGMDFIIACPKGYEPNEHVIRESERRGVNVKIVNDLKEATKEADVINIKQWVTPEMYKAARREVNPIQSPHFKNPEKYRKWIVNSKIVDLAKDDAIVMHSMPASRGEEATDEVLDGPKSVIIDEAENRLHVQKALLSLLMG
jgi:ornithine carbamoyltransferase